MTSRRSPECAAALIASLVRPGAAPRSSGGAASVDAGAVLRPESILSIVGVVRERPAARHNPGMSSGHMEIEIKSARVLATPPPGALPIQVGFVLPQKVDCSTELADDSSYIEPPLRA